MRRWLLAMLMACAGCGPEERSEPKAEPPPIAFDGALAAEMPSKIAHGERLTKALGCTGCHGRGLQGKRFYEPYASNLTRDLLKYSDADIENVLRTGIPPDGRDLWGMPSELFQHLSGPDMEALIVYMRTLKPAGPPTQPPLPFPKEVRDLIAKGEFKPAAAFVRESKALAPADLGPSHALGRYITRVTCAECHGPELKGGGDTPDLIAAGAYSREEFERLLTQGVPTGGRKLKLMELVAKERFAELTARERDALYAYLKARAERPQ